MIKEMLSDHIQVIKEVDNWEEGIKIAARPLLKQGYIESGYIDAMIESVVENGPYIVIMPKVAIPHAKSERGVLKTGISLLKLNKEVAFPDGKDVELMIVLAANDADTHLNIISELTDIFMDDDLMEQIFRAESKDEVLNILT